MAGLELGTVGVVLVGLNLVAIGVNGELDLLVVSDEVAFAAIGYVVGFVLFTCIVGLLVINSGILVPEGFTGLLIDTGRAGHVPAVEAGAFSNDHVAAGVAEVLVAVEIPEVGGLLGFVQIGDLVLQRGGVGEDVPAHLAGVDDVEVELELDTAVVHVTDVVPVAGVTG